MGILTQILVTVILLILAIAVVSMSIHAAALFIAIMLVIGVFGMIYDLVTKSNDD